MYNNFTSFIFITFLLGKDFYYRTNPNTLTETVSPIDLTYLPIQD